MRIIAPIPVWRRPDVFLQHLLHVCDWYTPFYILSLEDPEFQQNQALVKMFGYNYTIADNNPLGKKLNFGISLLSSQYPDYTHIMNLGSDDLVNPELIYLYAQDFTSDTPFFGISDVYFKEIIGKKRCLYLDKYNDDNCIGACRVINRRVIEAMKEQDEPIYTPESQSGLDNNSRLNIKRVLGIDDKVLETEIPYIVDLKSNTNINPLSMMGAFDNRFQDVREDWLMDFFKKRVPGHISRMLGTPSGFMELFYSLSDSFKRQSQTFEFLNNLHYELLGDFKYSDYNSFTVMKNRYK